MAPAVPSVRHHPRYDGYTVDWFVLRCPFCSEHHVHYDLMHIHPNDPGEALIHSCTVLGGRGAECTSITPLTKAGPNGTIYASADYFIVGIDRIPNTAELNSYFPMTDDFILYEEREVQPGYVYLLESNGFYKIGISNNPQKRIKSLQTASPVPIETIHIEKSDRYQQLENELHARYADYRTQGEWFAFPAPMIGEVIAAMKGSAV